MNRKFEVRWYECNLNEYMKRKFFTKIGAVIYASFLKVYDDVEPKIYDL